MANIQSGASILGGKYTLRKRVQRQVCKREEVDVRGMTGVHVREVCWRGSGEEMIGCSA